MYISLNLQAYHHTTTWFSTIKSNFKNRALSRPKEQLLCFFTVSKGILNDEIQLYGALFTFIEVGDLERTFY